MSGAAQARVDRRGNGATIGMAEHDEERRVEVATRVLQAGGDFRRQDISRDADDEQFTEAGIEDQFRRHSGIAATQDRGVGMLPFRELGQDFLLHRGESRSAGDKSFVACLESLQRFVG